MSSVVNVLHDHPHVRDEVRRRVQDAVAELGYRPLAIGQNLRRGRTGALGLAIPNFTQPYFAEIAGLAVTEAAESGLRLVAQQTDNRLDRELEVADAWNLGAADGLIFSPSVISDDDLDRRRGDMPLVLLGEHSRLTTVDRVGLDSVAMGRLATEHLIERGARRIAMIGHKTTGDSYVVSEREQGYRDALAAHGLTPAAEIVEVEDWTRTDGQQGVTRLLASGADFDALFCANDLLALGALRGLRTARTEGAAPVRVVGIDDIEEARFSDPSLSTVAIDRTWMVKSALRFVQRRLEQPDLPAEQVTAPHRLVQRESTR